MVFENEIAYYAKIQYPIKPEIMATLKNFEDLTIWKEARELVKNIYTDFQHIKDFGYRDQIQRASISIMNNIAEGFERDSNKEFIRFLYISKASCGEVRSML